MALSTPIVDMGWAATPFRLLGADSHHHALKNLMGRRGTLIAFVSNECPYVQAMMPRLIRDARELAAVGVNTLAISVDDSFAAVKAQAKLWELPFHYLHDESQAVARSYGAVCTPDFFGFDAELRLQYRGRLDAGRTEQVPDDTTRELFDAMRLIAHFGYGPGEQEPSIGCGIKWREAAEPVEARVASLV